MARGNRVSLAQPLLFVIPSDSRGIPTVQGSIVTTHKPNKPVIPSDSRGIPTVRDYGVSR